MSILRSFLIANGASEARFTADVEEFLGVTPGPGGAIVLTRCRGTAQPYRSMLVGPNGLALPQRVGDDWSIHTLLDGMEPPHGAKFLGGLSGAANGVPVGVFFYARKVAQDNAE
jgi:hypothetical protein